MLYLGDYLEDATVTIPFTTNAADGGRESFSASLEEADIVILKDGAAMTLDASTITISLDLNSRVGFHVVSVDMSNDADFTTGSDYAAMLYASDETLDSQAPAAVLATWSCENRVVDVGRISGSSTAADRLEQSCLAFPVGTVATAAGDANTATAFDTDLTQENDDYYGSTTAGMTIAFVETETNQFQTRRVVASTSVGANTRLTLESALDATVAVGDVFIIIGRITPN